MATPRTARRAALVLAGALGLAFAPAPAAFAFGVAAGAIAQVIWAVAR